MVLHLYYTCSHDSGKITCTDVKCFRLSFVYLGPPARGYSDSTPIAIGVVLLHLPTGELPVRASPSSPPSASSLLHERSLTACVEMQLAGYAIRCHTLSLALQIA